MLSTEEAAWFTADDPTRLMDLLGDRLPPRGGRLLALAACRRIKGLLIDPDSTTALDRIEAIVEGGLPPQFDFSYISRHVVHNWDVFEFTNAFDDAQREAVNAVVAAASEPVSAAACIQAVIRAVTLRGTQRTVIPSLVELIRDIVCNPFRPVTFAAAWRTSIVLGIAETIYADRSFGNLPVLADALEDAGCDHLDILSHCRGPGPHVRGCWVVDLVLGKS